MSTEIPESRVLVLKGRAEASLYAIADAYWPEATLCAVTIYRAFDKGPDRGQISRDLALGSLTLLLRQPERRVELLGTLRLMLVAPTRNGPRMKRYNAAMLAIGTLEATAKETS